MFKRTAIALAKELSKLFKKIKKGEIKTKTYILWHPESPGIKIKVKRTFVGKMTKPTHFATLSEAIKAEEQQKKEEVK